MPRPTRVIVPDVPVHITQRGVDRCPTFLADDDFAFYLLALREASQAARCAIHAYALMTNHIHVLATPSASTGPSRMMAVLGRRYVRFFNDRYRRTGTLWEGRFRSAPVSTRSYFLACTRYIELNPVRAGLVRQPEAYSWTSYRHNAGFERDPLITEHREYLALGMDRRARREAYRGLFEHELSAHTLAAIRASHRGREPLHATSYLQAVSALLEAPVASPRPPFDSARGSMPGAGSLV